MDAVRELDARLAFRRKCLDGIGNFLFPLFGVFPDINLVAPYGGFAPFIASLVAAVILRLMIVAFLRKGDVLPVLRRQDGPDV